MVAAMKSAQSPGPGHEPRPGPAQSQGLEHLSAVDKAHAAAQAPPCQEDRPTSKTLLPFRALPGNSPGSMMLEYHCVHQDGQRAPLHLNAGVPGHPMDLLYNPLGQCILELMRMFWALESQVDGIAKERDEALGRAQEAQASAQATAKSAAGTKQEFERQQQHKRGKGSSVEDI